MSATEEILGKILVVDDEDQIRMLLRRRLSKLNLDVVEAENGEQGLEILKGGGIDLVFSDIRMPVMDGIQFLEGARLSGILIPFIILSGYGDQNWLLRALRLGAYDFLNKPFDSKYISAITVKAVDFSKKQQEFYAGAKSSGGNDLVNLMPSPELRFAPTIVARELEKEDD